MFSEVVSNTDNFGSKPVYAGTFDFGEVGDTAYSLNIDPLHQADEEFDIMIQHGEEEFHRTSNIIIKVWKFLSCSDRRSRWW